MSPKDDEETTSSWKPPERQLRADGRMTGDHTLPPPDPVAVAPEPGGDGLPTLEALTTGELQLDRQKSAPAQYVAPGPYRPAVGERRPWTVVVALLGLGIGALALFALKPGLQHELPVPAGTKPTVMIFSDPDGATVRIAEAVVGVTPFAADNLWSGEVKFEVSAPGRQSKHGTFAGGRDFQVNLALPKQKSR